MPWGRHPYGWWKSSQQYIRYRHYIRRTTFVMKKMDTLPRESTLFTIQHIVRLYRQQTRGEQPAEKWNLFEVIFLGFPHSFFLVVLMAVHLRKWGTRANGFARYRLDTQCSVGHQNLFPENQIKQNLTSVWVRCKTNHKAQKKHITQTETPLMLLLWQPAAYVHVYTIYVQQRGSFIADFFVGVCVCGP
jgi:hypothetical protein